MHKKVLLISFVAVGVLLACSLSSVVQKAKEVAPTAASLASQVAPTVASLATQQAASTSAAPSAGSTPEAGQATGNGPVFKTPATENPDFKSFRLSMTFRITFTDRNKDYELLDLLEEVSAQGEHDVIRQDGKVAMEMIRLKDGRTWLRTGDTPDWVSIQNMQGVGMDPHHLLDMVDFGDLNWQDKGTETMEGVKVHHYVSTTPLPQSVIQEWMQGAAASHSDLAGMQLLPKKAVAEVYATEDGTVLKSVFSVEGTATQNGKSEPVSVVTALQVKDINADIQIKPPKGAQQASKAPFSLPDGAVQKMAVGVMQIYEVPNTTVADVVKFFDKHLPSDGFKISNRMGSDASGWMLTVSGKGKSYQVVIAPAENGTVSVTIAQQ